MTTQYAVLPARSGRSYTAKLFTVADPDTEVTGNTITVTERTNAKGVFRAGIARATALPAGDYILVYLYGTIGAAIGYFTFAGTDGETATDTPATVELDSSITDQLDVIQSGVEASLSRIATILERTPDDTGVITFAWPVNDATITGTVSINNASYTPIEGVIAFLRTDAGKHYYTLTHDAADRPEAAGSARYALTDGTYTRYMVLRVVESGDTGEAAALAILKLDWETITGEIPSRSVLNALRHIRNKWALAGDTKTVYAEDDVTPAYTTTVTADGAGNITADTPN